MDTTYRKNLKAVAQACKDYTDKTKEEIYWHIGDYSISTQSDNTTASTKTVPTGATRCKIKKIYGLTEKFNPSVAYDNASTMTKTMPNVVYDFDVSKVDGASEVSENIYTANPQPTINLIAGSNKWVGLDDIPIVNGKTYTIKFFNTKVANEVVQLVNYSYTTLTYSNSYTFTSNTDVLKIRIGNGDLSGDINYQLKLMIVEGSTAPTEFKVGYTGIHNFEWTGVKVYDSDNVEQVSKTIDLSTILYNGNSLFEGNSLKAVNDVKDYITPYVAHKGIGSRAYQSGDEEDTSVLTDGTTTLYELATPIEVSIDWSSTLRGITGYSNGTITLQNTYNMDTDNTITYNSIIKENCCAKIVQSRGGSVIKTINLTDDDVEYGYSSTNENNVRDYTTNVGTINVGKRAYESGDEEDTDVITDMEYTYYPLTTPTTESLTAIENVIEVEPNDTIAFLDENDNAVNVPSDLTYRIEVERV